MARAKLDRIDRRILSDLQSNGRMTNVELAERAGISAPPCLRRVRALERAGIIKGYHADLSPEALGYSVSVFALVGLSSQAETGLKSFEELIAKRDEGRDCHMLAPHLGAECQPREDHDGLPHRQAGAGRADLDGIRAAARGLVSRAGDLRSRSRQSPSRCR